MVSSSADSVIKAQPKIKVMTTRFGEIEIDAEGVINMTSPFLGFPESRRFFLRPHSAESPFMWLQSMDEPTLAFVVIQPALINPHYKPEVDIHLKTELAVGSENDLEFLVILTIPKNKPAAMTANLLGPVAINIKKRLAKQVLLDPAKYDLCWPVVKNM